MTEHIARTLCYASRAHPRAAHCPFCDERGRCKKQMWETFLPEAEAVWAMLNKAGVIKRPNLLPGLGG